MAPKQPWRVPLLGWGNIAVGLLAPVGATCNILHLLQRARMGLAAESAFLTGLAGLILGYLNWSSGRAVLQREPWAFQRTCVAGAVMVGYTALGMLVFAISRADSLLVLLLQHGFGSWRDWSLDRFRNSAILEIPGLAWAVFGLGTAVRFRLAGAPERWGERLGYVLGFSFSLVILGGMGRFLQLLLADF